MMKSFVLAAALAGTLATPALAQDRWDWSPGDRPYRLVGAGVQGLYPELRGTPRGRAFVMRNFDRNRDGRISPREAADANEAFAQIAGPRRDRFDWAARDRTVVVETREVVPVGQWDRRAMHDYGFRQTPRGATLTLSEDVLFATDSDVLRPGAIDKLRPLAGYLRSNPGVRVAIDGYTDSRGTNAHNQDLSERRAASVRAAFDAMDVTRARFSVAGHGEANPVATNATAAGMRQNRRVEVTLLGRRATEFARY
ncbi:OmpA family protein [Sphingomonas sp. RP10(2022)]|uniref:OmpA family protein n=1 Tax=Sphingomonas liriopis TaxID=2949094 RepID=A0A9X2HSN2_9SPHN|nr:OmpA family protein [Sphingomonas liriopis]MCP3735812.1 OmpA family protein [Sphingomonas liriopis]